MRMSVRNGLILTGVILIGLLLRTHSLTGESIWLDEVSSIALAKSSMTQIFENTLWGEHPPIYFIVLHYWSGLFGDSEFSVRFLSVLAGTLAIFMTYKVGALLFDRDVGLLGSLLVVFSRFHIWNSQDARMYAFMPLVTLLSMYFFIKLVDKKTLATSAGYLLSSLLLVSTHFYGIFIVVAQNIYLFTMRVFSKKEVKIGIAMWILMQAILLIPVSLFIKAVLRLGTAQRLWIATPSVGTLIATFSEYSGSRLLLLLFLFLSLISILGCEKTTGSANRRGLLSFIGDYRWHMDCQSIKKVYLLLLWLLTPIVIPFVISLFSSPMYTSRYAIGASLAFYLLVAAGIKKIGDKAVKVVIIGFVVVVSLMNLAVFYPQITNDQWREVAHYVSTNVESGDLLLFN
ncbi:MAG: glycosyltransferase family 39 protein, partial [Candidatus Altiarchaeota archaeon]